MLQTNFKLAHGQERDQERDVFSEYKALQRMKMNKLTPAPRLCLKNRKGNNSEGVIHLLKFGINFCSFPPFRLNSIVTRDIKENAL